MDKNAINIQVIAKDLASKVLKDINSNIKDTGKATVTTNQEGGASFLKLAGAFGIAQIAADLFTKSIGFVVGSIETAITSAKNYADAAVDSFNRTQKALTTLDIIAERFGTNGEKAQRAAQALAKELRIGIGATSESLQNLLATGLNLDQATDLLKRFTNEAMTGKSETITLSQAVQNLSFAYKTSNSALGNLSGVNENFNDIIEKGRKLLVKEGKSLNEITDEQAKYRGMIELTNLTLGSSERFRGTLIDSLAEQQFLTEQLSNTIGEKLEPAYRFVTNVQNQFLQTILKIIEMVDQLIHERMDQIRPILDSISESWKTLTGLFSDSNSTIEDVGIVMGNLITDTIINGLSTFSGILQGIVNSKDAIVEALNNMKTAFFGLDDQTAMNTESAKQFGIEIGTNLSEGFIKITELVTEFLKQLKDPNSDVRNFMDDLISLTKIVVILVSSIGDLVDLMKELFRLSQLPIFTASGAGSQTGQGRTGGGSRNTAVNDILSSKSLTSQPFGVRKAHGADFIVPPGFPNDTFPMRVQSGEHVQVTPANEVNNNSKKSNVVVNNNNYFSSFVDTDMVASRLAFQLGGVR